MNPSLTSLATLTVDGYIDACGSLVTPTLSGLLDVESANASGWALAGYAWADVCEALKAAWAAR